MPTSFNAPATEPGEFTDSELHSSRIDQYKAQIDVIKHLATLDTGTLLVIVAFVERTFKAPHHQYLVGLAVLLLLASLIASAFACLTVLAGFPRRGARRMGRDDRRDHLLSLSMTFFGFLFGIAALALFFGLNWFF